MSDRPQVTRSETVRRTITENERAGPRALETLVGYTDRALAERGFEELSLGEIEAYWLFVRRGGVDL